MSLRLESNNQQHSLPTLFLISSTCGWATSLSLCPKAVSLCMGRGVTCFACENESESESAGGHAAFHGGHVTVTVTALTAMTTAWP